jgi:predicted membrane chloride channel (bestrophin family)
MIVHHTNKKGALYCKCGSNNLHCKNLYRIIIMTKFSTVIIMLVLFHIPVSKNVLVCSPFFDLNISCTLSLYLSLKGKTND